ncbi:hypothetical protein [Nocardia thailandica]|uniref:DUF4232 domain-containing protein n=1 Tax=Nocardia thailandica TaxID=257275 RepID=A0ABW6PHF0_9NOCA
MLEPTGPLPPEIYWRRRALAVGVAVVVLAVVALLIVMAARGGDSAGEDAAAVTSSSTTAAPASSSAASSSSTTSTSAAAGSSTTTSGAPIAAEPCPDQSLAVKVTVGRPTYKLGEQPTFGIVVTNISAGVCSRDLGSGLPQVAVLSIDGQRRLWASNDCNPGGQPDVRNLKPGEQAAFTVNWLGSTSQPNCAGERIQVPAGAYSVVAQLGAINSAAEPFNIA